MRISRLSASELCVIKNNTNLDLQVIANRLASIPLHNETANPEIELVPFFSCSCKQRGQSMCEKCVMYLHLRATCQDVYPFCLNDKFTIVNESMICKEGDQDFFHVEFKEFMQFINDDLNTFTVTKIEEKNIIPRENVNYIPAEVLVTARNSRDCAVQFRMPENRKTVYCDDICRWRDRAEPHFGRPHPNDPSFIAQKQLATYETNARYGLPCESKIGLFRLKPGEEIEMRILVKACSPFPICSAYLSTDDNAALHVQMASDKEIQYPMLMRKAINLLKFESQFYSFGKMIDRNE